MRLPYVKTMAERIMKALAKSGRRMTIQKVWRAVSLSDLETGRFMDAIDLLIEQGRITKSVGHFVDRNYTAPCIEMTVLERLARIPGIKEHEQAVPQGDSASGGPRPSRVQRALEGKAAHRAGSGKARDARQWKVAAEPKRHPQRGPKAGRRRAH